MMPSFLTRRPEAAIFVIFINPVRLFEIPAAMRGITSERTLGTYGNLDDALDALIGGIVAYLAS